MEQIQAAEQTATQSVSEIAAPAIEPFRQSHSGATLAPQAGGTCGTCGKPAVPNSNGTGVSGWVYAIGRIEPRFPSIGVEKELAQATAQAITVGLTDGQTLYEVLKQHRYLARQMCWVLTIGGVETYILQPHDPADFVLLVEAINPAIDPINRIDVVIGMRGPIAPPEMCNGLMVPVAAFEQMYSFDRETFVQAVPRPDSIPQEQEPQFRAAVRELFDRIMQMADNAGATDDHRALNYLAVRFPGIYAKTAEQHLSSSSLAGLEVRPSPLGGVRKIVEAIFSYAHRQADVTEKFFIRVDVTEPFPFLVTKLSPYYDRCG